MSIPHRERVGRSPTGTLSHLFIISCSSLTPPWYGHCQCSNRQNCLTLNRESKNRTMSKKERLLAATVLLCVTLGPTPIAFGQAGSSPLKDKNRETVSPASTAMLTPRYLVPVSPVRNAEISESAVEAAKSAVKVLLRRGRKNGVLVNDIVTERETV